jgi:nitrogen fixation protein FixH
VKFSVKDLDGKVVENAKLKVVFTLPYTSKSDITLEDAKFDGQTYYFDSITLPNPGRWNIMTRVEVGNEYKFYNLHADTRNPNTFEY